MLPYIRLQNLAMSFACRHIDVLLMNTWASATHFNEELNYKARNRYAAHSAHIVTRDALQDLPRPWDGPDSTLPDAD